MHNKHFITVAFIGAESSGKTTISSQMHNIITDSILVPEYGRILGEYTDNVYLAQDMAHIVSVQIRMEEKAKKQAVRQYEKNKVKQFIFCDTTPLVTNFYFDKWYAENIPKYDILEKHKNRKYDYMFFCQNDFPFVDDGSRNGIEFAFEQQEYYKKYLTQEFIELKGSVEERIEIVTSCLLQEIKAE